MKESFLFLIVYLRFYLGFTSYLRGKFYDEHGRINSSDWGLINISLSGNLLLKASTTDLFLATPP